MADAGVVRQRARQKLIVSLYLLGTEWANLNKKRTPGRKVVSVIRCWKNGAILPVDGLELSGIQNFFPCQVFLANINASRYT